MEPFEIVRASSVDEAIAGASKEGSAFIAGGTSLVDLLRLGTVAHPRLVDLRVGPLGAIESTPDGVRVGALVKNTELAYHPLVRASLPVLSEAILAGASPQIRNMASVGGNLLQRPRCSYFRDPGSPCNKRLPGSGCPSMDGYARPNAVLGGSAQCIAVHPSDMCVAMAALGAVVHVRGAAGERRVAFDDFHLLPGDHPERENVLRPGELVTHVTLPVLPWFKRSLYVKVRDRASYAFALASVAVALDVDGARIRDARVALGGVAPKPWRSHAAEAALIGRPLGMAAYEASARAALAEAKPRPDNAFKVPLTGKAIVRALATLEERS
jgi:xanthine dehydrogenase YagS FAD-binding subunit